MVAERMGSMNEFQSRAFVPVLSSFIASSSNFRQQRNPRNVRMPKKIRVGVLVGGKSAEHEVALQSAKNVIEAIDKQKYDVVLVGIDKKGKWYLNEASNYLLHAENPKL